jgi:hypothetical protein
VAAVNGGRERRDRDRRVLHALLAAPRGDDQFLREGNLKGCVDAHRRTGGNLYVSPDEPVERLKLHLYLIAASCQARDRVRAGHIRHRHVDVLGTHRDDGDCRARQRGAIRVENGAGDRADRVLGVHRPDARPQRDREDQT